MLQAEKIFSLFMLVVGILGFYSSVQLRFFGLGGGVGSGFFPLILSSLIILLSIIYFCFLLFKPKEIVVITTSKQAILTQVKFTVALLACVFLIPIIGMLVSFGLFTFAVLLIIVKRTWYDSMIFSVINIGALYIIFELFLSMSLPTGSLF